MAFLFFLKKSFKSDSCYSHVKRFHKDLLTLLYYHEDAFNFMLK